MRYSYEFKKKCVERYHKGIYPDTLEDIDTKKFRGIGKSNGEERYNHRHW